MTFINKGDAHVSRDCFAQIVEEQRDLYWIQSTKEKMIRTQARLAGKLRESAGSRADLPCVGDWVVTGSPPIPGQLSIIESVMPRKTILQRIDPGTGGNGLQNMAANVDVVGVVTSCNADLNERRLERYLAQIAQSGARAIIILNKSDLVADVWNLVNRIERRLSAVQCLALSAETGDGLTELLLSFGPEETLALLGMSGVGKSSLINALLGGNAQVVQGIRVADSRGRHTTTARKLFTLRSGHRIIDTPGIRELQLSAGAETSLEDAFHDIQLYSKTCRFSDCQHRTEPGCGVLSALASRELSEDRWSNYLKLQRELDFHSRKTDKALAAQEKKRWKEISKSMKNWEVRKKWQPS